MKKNRIFGLASGLALLMAGACSNDLIDPGKQNPGKPIVDPEDGVFMAVSFDLPSAKETRSYTDGPNSSSGGTEEGYEDENNVSSALVVLARATNNAFIAAGYADGASLYPVGTEGTTYRTTAKITKTALTEFYDLDDLGPDDKDADGHYKVNVFVFANPTSPLKQNFIAEEEETGSVISFGNTDWVNLIGVYNPPAVTDGTEVRPWAPDHFLMANSSICERHLPADIADWDNYNVATNAFNLTGMNNYGRPNQVDNLTQKGNIEVERAAARYDFRDGALDGEATHGLPDPNNPQSYEFNGFTDQTYHMLLDSESKPLVDLYLGKMSLVNMNKEYYYLRRVSNNGYQQQGGDDNTNNWQLLGIELPWFSGPDGTRLPDNGNYIVDASADWKRSGPGAPAPQTGYADNFMYPFFRTIEGQNTGNNLGVLPDNLNEGDMVQNNFGNSALEKEQARWYTSEISKVLAQGRVDKSGRYHTWRYLTEGTIPGISSQKNSVSNGIVFKGQMLPALTREDAAAQGKDYFTQLLMETLEPRRNENAGVTAPRPFIYVALNHLYCSWEHVRRTAIYLSLTEIRREANGEWTFQIDRTTRLYNAVFGTGGFGEVTFEITGSSELKDANFLINPNSTGTDIFTLRDATAQDQNSANYLYNKWKTDFNNPDDIIGNEDADYEAFSKFRDKAVSGDIALHQESFDEELGGWAYYCYYYYWNRHNDNGEPGVMGPMEFAVVRNNVYKLAVTKVAAPGHPGITANDPDSPTPDTPDEQGDVYITVSCTTLPWVVRENTIVF